MNNEKYMRLLTDLKRCFQVHKQHFENLTWDIIESKLWQNIEKMESLLWMEKTGGKPCVLEFDSKTNTIVFCDFSAESPIGRRNLCYDQQALDSRKRNKPVGSVIKKCLDNNVQLFRARTI